MTRYFVNIYPWEKPRVWEGEEGLNKGEAVIVALEYCNELGNIDKIAPENEEVLAGSIIRRATERDKKAREKRDEEREECLKTCKEEIKNLSLAMKLVDVLISLDGKQAIFAFTSDGRVDFRELVRSLSTKLKKSIRMQQIGSRDEARRLGGYGICGRELCCVRSGMIQSITTDMARAQQIAHRGADRISGLCGRLMCCLAYEAEQYREMLQGMPELFSSIETKEGRGIIIEINAPQGEIKVKLESGKFITIKKEDILS